MTAKKRNDKRRDAAKDNNAWEVDPFSSLGWTDFGTKHEFRQNATDNSFFNKMTVNEPSFRGKHVTIHIEPSQDEANEEPPILYQALQDENPAFRASAALERGQSSEIVTMEEEYPDPSLQLLEEDEEHEEEEDDFDAQLTALVASRSLLQNIFHEPPQRTKYRQKDIMRPAHLMAASGRNEVSKNSPPSIDDMSTGPDSSTPSMDDVVAEAWLLSGTLLEKSFCILRKKESTPPDCRMPRHAPNVKQTPPPPSTRTRTRTPPTPTRSPPTPPPPPTTTTTTPRTPDHYNSGQQHKSRSKAVAMTPIATAASIPASPPLRGYSNSNGRVTAVSVAGNDDTTRFVANSVSSSASGPVNNLNDNDNGPKKVNEEWNVSSQDVSFSNSTTTRDRSGPVDLDDDTDDNNESNDDDMFDDDDEIFNEMNGRHDGQVDFSSFTGDSVDSDLKKTRLLVQKKKKKKNARYSNREVFQQTIAATVIKETKETKTGMVFLDDEDGNVFISKINPRGLFAETALEVGFQIVSVNNIDCRYKGLDYVVSLVRESRGAVTVVALRNNISGNGTSDRRESVLTAAANRSPSSWQSTSTKTTWESTWESQSLGCDEHGSVVSEMTDPFLSREVIRMSGPISGSQRWEEEEEESTGSGFTLTTGAFGDISASSSTSGGQAYPVKDESYRHVMNSGVLWLTLVGQHVRFPSAWFHGARAPHLGVSNLLTRNGDKKPQHRWAYIARDLFYSEPILNEFVPNKHSPGRLLMHLVIRDENWRPVQDVAIGCFHPYSPALSNEKGEDSRVLWLAIRRRSGHRVGSTSLIDPILASECRIEDVAADTPLGRGKPIQNKKLMAIFGENPPVQTAFVLETELVKKVRASRDRGYITDFKPITLLLLELFLETRAEL